MTREAGGISISFLERITAAAFGQRRKMLRSSLATLGVDTTALLRDAEIDPTLRAEQLSIDDFVRLAHHLERQQLTRLSQR
jgi:16S rRNA (adenine1518-N6/adenine1519-N6)-dimethyltransferase